MLPATSMPVWLKGRHDENINQVRLIVHRSRHDKSNHVRHSRYNRQRRNLMQGFNLMRGVLLRALDLAQDRHCVIDSLPLPVIRFHLVPGSKGEWPTYGAAYGKVPSKKQTIYGYKLHLLITLEAI